MKNIVLLIVLLLAQQVKGQKLISQQPAQTLFDSLIQAKGSFWVYQELQYGGIDTSANPLCNEGFYVCYGIVTDQQDSLACVKRTHCASGYQKIASASYRYYQLHRAQIRKEKLKSTVFATHTRARMLSIIEKGVVTQEIYLPEEYLWEDNKYLNRNKSTASVQLLAMVEKEVKDTH